MPTPETMDPLHLFLTDPVLLVGSLLPLLMLGGLLIYRIRVSRRFAAMAKRNSEALQQNAVRWDEAAARTEKMIALLTEIRDQIARNAPDSPGS